MSEHLTVYTQPLPFALLTPKYCQPRTGTILHELGLHFNNLQQNIDLSPGVVAIDFETRGTDPTLPDNYIVGMGLAWSGGNVYIPLIGNESTFYVFLRWLTTSDKKLIAHNIYFDGQWVWNNCGRHPNWHACTYALYRHLATEGWAGQKYGLKDAMVQLLLWPEANTAELDQWLITNGYANKAGNPLYGEMWRAPTEILGKYCTLDAEATYLLYTEILEPVLREFPALEKYHTKSFMCLLQKLIEQKAVGIDIDVEKLHAAHKEIEGEISDVETWLRTDSPLAEPMGEWEDQKYAEFLTTMPSRWKKFELGEEPIKFTKAGDVSKSWANWDKKRAAGPQQSKNWEKWEEHRKAVEAGTDTRCQFNLRSGDHLRWLFYEKLGHQPFEFTPTGLPTVDTDSLKQFGEEGIALEKYLLLQKEYSFTTKYLELTEHRNTVHPGFRVPGTLTGRLSGTEPNIQQVPKSRRFLECLRARPGRVWIDADFSSLEPVVTAEFSQDPTLMAIYGPDAQPGSDIYLHTGAGIPALAGAIRAAGYRPEVGITPEIAAYTKKVCKKERAICKTLFLGANYGAGPKKIWKTLNMQGVEISLEDVQVIHQQFWQLYAGVKRFGARLLDQWRANKGFIYNGAGRPLGIHQDYTKDIVNRFSQSTGHDILILYVEILVEELGQLNWTPIVMDFHDEVILEVPEEEQQLAIDAFRRSEVRLNQLLGGAIPLRINPVVVRTLADAKLE